MPVVTLDIDALCLYLKRILDHRVKQMKASAVFSASLLSESELQRLLRSMLNSTVDSYISSVLEQHSFQQAWEQVSRPILGLGYRATPAVMKRASVTGAVDSLSSSGVDVSASFKRMVGQGWREPVSYLTSESLVEDPADAEPDLFLLQRSVTGAFGWQGSLCEYDFRKSGTHGPCSGFERLLQRRSLPALLTWQQKQYTSGSLADMDTTGLLLAEREISADYSAYFDQCAPLACTYTDSRRVDTLSGVFTVIGLAGGSVSILSFVVSTFVGLFVANKRDERGDYAPIRQD